jgi:hypothetical protein
VYRSRQKPSTVLRTLNDLQWYVTLFAWVEIDSSPVLFVALALASLLADAGPVPRVIEVEPSAVGTAPCSLRQAGVEEREAGMVETEVGMVVREMAAC